MGEMGPCKKCSFLFISYLSPISISEVWLSVALDEKHMATSLFCFCGTVLWKRYTHFSSLKLHQKERKINTYADDLMKSNQGKGEKRSIKYSQHK